ncbi:hypothetical protein [Galactobacillus timonensis]|uniref:hypothetical protein n=1 Tax=Galactobacillus timonensis TaxID=2041840 RepID=UPI0023F0F5EE|nr:hypothetical protein [Galactobacillus timonensis]MCI6753795.1 hypothetical protein [Galactobacillus timonensis]
MQISDLNLTRWKKRKDILRELNGGGAGISDRAFRKWVEDFNKTYDGRKQPEYIVHGPKGYKITQDRTEIKKSIADNDRRAITILRQTRRVRRFLGMKDQLSLLDQEDKA